MVLLATLERTIARTLETDEAVEPASPLAHVLWFLDGAALFYLVSWVGTTRRWLDKDLYYAIYIWVSLTFFWYYIRTTGVDVLAWFHQRWRLSLFLGLLAGVYVVVTVWRARVTAGPGGWLLTFEVLWRGIAYGAVDSLVMTTFPLAVAHGILRGRVDGLARRVAFGALTLLLVWALSAAYHIGFRQFDSSEAIRPRVTRTAIAIPAIVRANPIGSMAAQTAMNITATMRTFESWEFVPPHVEFIRDYEPPGVFGPH